MKPASSACAGAPPATAPVAAQATASAAMNQAGQPIPAMLRPPARCTVTGIGSTAATPPGGSRTNVSVSVENRQALAVKSTALATTVAATALAGLIGAASSAHADPLNPRDPDYCGNSPDILLCTEQKSTYPSPGELAYLNAIRGWFPPRSEEHTSELQSRGHLV